ncbi:hypothetical protein ABIB51_004234 [Arthrobacter sp. UYCu712]
MVSAGALEVLAPQADRARTAATPVAAPFRMCERKIGTLSQNGM